MALSDGGAHLLPPPAPHPLLTRADVARGAALAASLALLGAPLGILWALITPRAELVGFPDGGLGLDDVEDKAFIATDGTFFFLTLGVGLALGVLAWFVGRGWSVGAVLGGVAGAALAAAVALETGQLFDQRLGTFADRDRSIADGVPLTLPNELLPDSSHSWLLVLGLPAGFALGFAVLAYLRIGPPEPVAVSSGTRSPGRSRAWEPPAAPAAGPPRA